jgi:hypothetical protein
VGGNFAGPVTDTNQTRDRTTGDRCVATKCCKHPHDCNQVHGLRVCRPNRAEVVGTNPPLAGFDATKGDNDWALVLFSRSELKDETPPWLISPGDWSAVEAIDPRQWC